MGKKSRNQGETNNNDDENTKNEEKKYDSGKQENMCMIVVVLKTDLHCDGCASRLTKYIRSFQGVESVKGVDVDLNKLTVIGNLDPSKLRELIELKTKKKVEIISPAPKKDKNKSEGDGKDKKNSGEKPAKNSGEKPAKNSDEKKSKDPPVTTAVLKVSLHCDGCVQKIQKLVQKTKGYMDMSIDKQKEVLTVKGTMDMKALAALLMKKLKRNVEIVPAKKEGGGGGGGGDGGKKAKNEGGDEAGKSGGEKSGGKMEGNKMVQFGSEYEYGYPYMYEPGYMATHLHAPQLFSDENPNACVVM